MTRYLRYLRIAFEMSIYRSLEYRSGVLIQYALDLIWYGVQFALLNTAFQYVPQIGGYTQQEAYVFLGLLYLVDATNMTFFDGGINHLTYSIRNGALDHYLLKPMPTLFQAAVARVSLSGTFNLVFALGFWVFTFTRFPMDYPPERWFLAAALFVNGLIINAVMRLLVASLAFWSTEGGTLNWLYHELLRFGSKPESIYAPGLRRVLSSAIPVLLVTAWPCMALVRDTSTWERTYPFLVGAGSFLLLQFVWWRGVRRYEGVSFQ